MHILYQIEKFLAIIKNKIIDTINKDFNTMNMFKIDYMGKNIHFGFKSKSKMIDFFKIKIFNRLYRNKLQLRMTNTK